MNKKIVAQNETVVIGADVHAKKHVVTVKFNDQIKGTKHLAPNPDAWRSFLSRFPGCLIHVVYESGPQGYNLFDWLTNMQMDNGATIKVYVAPPAQVPKVPGKKVKTDKRDSIALILAFETGSFRPVVVPERMTREQRELTRTRDQTKNMQKRIKNQLLSMLKFHGVQYCEKGKWSRKWLKQLNANVKACDTTGCLLVAFKTKLDLFHSITKTLQELDKRIFETMQSGNDRCAQTARKIEQLPGIGWFSASIIAAEVADFRAFDNSAAFASYVGIVPSEHSSGETTRRGHITKAGNRRLRCIFVQCAWAWIRRDEQARRQFNRIRMGKQDRSRIAITAMARKLAVKTYHKVVSQPPTTIAA